MYIFIISHPHFTERYRYITEHVASVSRLPREIVGIDGKELARRPDFAGMRHAAWLSPGQIGCSLAH